MGKGEITSPATPHTMYGRCKSGLPPQELSQPLVWCSTWQEGSWPWHHQHNRAGPAGMGTGEPSGGYDIEREPLLPTIG